MPSYDILVAKFRRLKDTTATINTNLNLAEESIQALEDIFTGTSSQFVKADGTLDSNTYLTGITGETLSDLQDVPAEPTGGTDSYALVYDDNTDTFSWVDITTFGGGGASQLSDLSDVNTSTPTNRNVLVADGIDWESRALVGEDIGITPFSHIQSNNVQTALEEIVGNQIIESGFADRVSSVISFTDGTRTFEIDVAGDYTEFSFWVDGDKFTKTTAESIVIPDLEGPHYIYYDETGTLVSTQTFTEDIITRYSFVAFVYWDATNSQEILFGDERHGREMDSATHVLLHRTSGTQYDSGLAITDIVADASGDLATHAQVGVQDGLIRDEDIPLLIVDGSPQTLAAPAQIPLYYRDGASGVWRRIAATDYIVTTTGSGRAAWNEWTGATWQLTEVGNNNFVLTHLYATNDVIEPIIGIIGEAEYNTTGAARTGAETEILDLSFGPLDDLLPEWKPIGTIILQTSSGYANAVQSRIRTTDEGANYIDWRFSDFTSVGGGIAGDHGGLTGLSDDDHLQYHNDTRGDARYYTQTQLDAGQLDNRYYTETEVDSLTWDASDIVSGTFADARIAESNVTQHQAALTITRSQVSDLRGNYSLSFQNPTSSEKVYIDTTDVAITITRIEIVIQGTTPSLTWTIRHGTDPSATGSEVVTSGTTSTTTNAVTAVTSFNDATIVANSAIWFETTGASGTIDNFLIKVYYTED